MSAPTQGASGRACSLWSRGIVLLPPLGRLIVQGSASPQPCRFPPHPSPVVATGLARYTQLPSLSLLSFPSTISGKPVLPLEHVEGASYICLCSPGARRRRLLCLLSSVCPPAGPFTAHLQGGGFLPMWASVPWNSHGIPCFLACSQRVFLSVTASVSPLSPLQLACLCPGPGKCSKCPLVDCLVSLFLSLFFPPPPFSLSETVSLCSPGRRGTTEIPVAGIKGSRVAFITSGLHLSSG